MIRPIAIYLPQFHPIPENDAWWGKDFTEWTNTKKATARFKDHYQPHIPSALGYYDLRSREVQQEQARLAKENGIYGFCYYHYWFNGRRVLETPLENILSSSDPDFPFCICWANENWTRRWDGKEQDVLLKQEYSFDDDIAHINYLKRYFDDKRYIRVDGKPVFVIYRPALFPDIKKTIGIWRSECIRNGTGDIYIACMTSFGNKKSDPLEMGFDAAIEFQPDFSSFPKPRVARRGLERVFGPFKEIPHAGADAKNVDRVYLYDRIADIMMNRKPPVYKTFPGLFPMWDNTARRETGATIVHGSTPEKYGQWLEHIKTSFKPFSKEENFIFINAWNEWAEGNHLEPCEKWGDRYLRETKRVLGA